MPDTVTVKQLDCDELTLDYLEKFLHRHGWPDLVIVHPADFVRLCTLSALIFKTVHATDRLLLLGTEWVRGQGYSTELDWQTHELRALER